MAMAMAEKKTEGDLDLEASIPQPSKSEDHMSPTEKIVPILFAVAIAGFFLLYSFSTSSLKVHVTDASLAQFNHTTNNGQLHYNLALNISIRNPNTMIGLFYDTIEAKGYYQDRIFGNVSSPVFYQGHKNRSVLSPVFHGQRLFWLTNSEISNFDSETSDGVYSFELILILKGTAKTEYWFKTAHFQLAYVCALQVPLTSTGKSADQTTPCQCYYF
jgi:hypothetical protein